MASRSSLLRALIPLSVLSVSLFVLQACGNDSPTGPTAYVAPYSQTDLRVGTGTEAVTGSRVTVNYAGWLYDPTRPDNKGQQFDPQPPGVTSTFTMVLGARTVIEGWERGIPGMRVGGLRRLVIPAELAYGSQGRNPIPPNATIMFDVELLSVQ